MKNRLCGTQIKSNALLTCLSVSTMCLLVYASVIIITLISITPIIILGLGEISAGQRDVILTPYRGDYLNTTLVSILSQQRAMPRLSTSIIINRNTNGLCWFMDLELEQQQHLGTLPLNNNIGEGFQPIYLHNQYGISQGTIINIQIVNFNILQRLQKTLTDQNAFQELQQLSLIRNMGQSLGAPFKVAGVFNQAFGKFPVGVVGGYAYVNYNTAFRHLIKSTLKQLKKQNSKLVKHLENESNFKASDYAQSIIINLPNRINVYSNSDYQKTYDTLSQFGAEIIKKIGMFSVQSEIPIAAKLIDMSYFGMFIGVILKMVIISLFVLSVLMMNNMMTTGTDRKSFDFALLKTMGANKRFVIINLLFSSFKYVLISNLIAFPFANITLGSVSSIFYTFFGYSYDITPTLGSIVGGLFIGVLVPIIASIAPIWGIINNDLVQNLNPIRNKTQAIHTEIFIEGREFPVGKLLFGVISSAFGLMIYYLLPKGLINQNVGLLLSVFFTILVGLLLGLILLAYSIQYIFQRFIAYLTLFWINKTDFILVLKNMSAHRFKNRRTSLLYSLSVAFIIFTSVGISIQIQTIRQEIIKGHGTYMQVISASATIQRSFYDQILENQFKEDIIDWTYQTSDLYGQLMMNSQVNKIQFSDKAKIFFINMKVYGVSPNFAKVLEAKKLPISKSYAEQPYDPYEFLYTPEGFKSCTISQYVAKKFNMLYTDNREFLINIYKQDRVQRLTLNMSTVFSQRLGFFYGKFEFLRHDVGVSFDTYAYLLGLRTYNQLPIARIKIKVKDPENTADLANRLRSRIAQRNIDTVWDFSQVKDTIDKIQNLLKNILNILLVLVLLISFFSLVTTSYINIINQSNEIGILLTLGYQKSRIVRIFIFQSFVLVLNSCLIGVAVGTFVAWMMGLQRELFGDYQMANMQVDGIWIIVVAAILSSILSIIKPIKQLFSQSINQIFMHS